MNATTQPEIVFTAISLQILGGYKRATDEDIAAAGGVLPKTDVLTRGGKHIFPSEKLAPFHALKKQLMRDVGKVSVKSIGGALAFNKEDIVEVETLIKEAQKEFATLLVEFRKNYDANLSAYIAGQANAGLSDIIRKSALGIDEAAARFGFSYEMYVPQPVGDGSTIESMASNLAGRLYVEIAQAAFEVWDKSLMPEDKSGNRAPRKAGQKTKRPLNTCRDKLVKLAFLDSNIQNSVDLINDVLAETQSQGFIEDTPSNPCATRLVRLVELMMDAQKFRSASTVVYGDLSAVDQLLGIAAKSAPAVEVETEEEETTAPVVAPQKVVAPDRFANFF